MKLWSPNLDATYQPGFLAPTHPQVPYQPDLPWRQTGVSVFRAGTRPSLPLGILHQASCRVHS